MKRRTVRLLAATAMGAAMFVAGCSTIADMTGGGVTPHSQMAADLGMPTASPESQGFTTAGLDALTSEFRGLVDQQKLAGVTTLVARHGKIVHFDTYGKANAATGDALRPDSIFRIASMTKPITGVAMMQLWEQGKWQLSDPVSKYIPEFAGLKVKGPNGALAEQTRPMTMAQLMSHSAGFGVSAVYDKDNLGETNLQGMIDKLKKLPLETQPGTAWDYGPSVNIQGYIVEKLSGQSLDAYFDQHIFKPLGMVDTGFWVSPEKASRVVAIHTYDSAGKIKGPDQNRVTTSKPSFLAGSGGLMSTAEDYWRFAQAVGNGGEFNGKRILKADTIKLMRTNVLQPGVKVDLYGPSQEGIGFGMDFAIVLDPKAATTPQGLNSFYWGGAFGTWFWIDPTNDLVFVGMIQNLNGSTPTGGTPQTRVISPRITYAALTDPSK
ncbi:MAG: serine hydrolase domain-containing protein [Hyphomonadaceae bacterium]